jgi:hypothetical protein
MEITIKDQVDNINRGVQEFIKCIDLLPESLFLKKMDGWTPRDVTAHLIGWNLYTIKGCQQLKRGELPFYFIDPGDDFCKVNALLVTEYDFKDKKRLIAQLNASTEKLKKFLIVVDPADWETNFGVKYMGETITIKNSVDALISDFITHRQQIEQWAKIGIAALRSQ